MRYLACLLVLASCSEGPDYRVHDIDVITADGFPERADLKEELDLWAEWYAEWSGCTVRHVRREIFTTLASISFWNDRPFSYCGMYLVPRRAVWVSALDECGPWYVLWHELLHHALLIDTGDVGAHDGRSKHGSAPWRAFQDAWDERE